MTLSTTFPKLRFQNVPGKIPHAKGMLARAQSDTQRLSEMKVVVKLTPQDSERAASTCECLSIETACELPVSSMSVLKLRL
jgi:hypothetical protein